MTTNVDEPAKASPPTGPSGNHGSRSGLSRVFNARVLEAAMLPIAL